MYVVIKEVKIRLDLSLWVLINDVPLIYPVQHFNIYYYHVYVVLHIVLLPWLHCIPGLQSSASPSNIEHILYEHIFYMSCFIVFMKIHLLSQTWITINYFSIVITYILSSFIGIIIRNSIHSHPKGFQNTFLIHTRRFVVVLWDANVN